MEKQAPYICGEKVYLRPIERQDYDLILEMWNDARLGKVAGAPYPKTKAGHEQHLDKMLSEGWGHEGFFFSACRWEDEAVVGIAYLWHLDYLVGKAEFSICLTKAEYLNCGYGTDIARTILNFGFGTLGLQRIYLTCDAEDPRSTGCYQKIGYVVEGRLRREHRQDGRLTDALVMSILREEWEAIRGINNAE